MTQPYGMAYSGLFGTKGAIMLFIFMTNWAQVLVPLESHMIFDLSLGFFHSWDFSTMNFRTASGLNLPIFESSDDPGSRSTSSGDRNLFKYALAPRALLSAVA
jgi:hypothetical protein